MQGHTNANQETSMSVVVSLGYVQGKYFRISNPVYCHSFLHCSQDSVGAAMWCGFSDSLHTGKLEVAATGPLHDVYFISSLLGKRSTKT